MDGCHSCTSQEEEGAEPGVPLSGYILPKGCQPTGLGGGLACGALLREEEAGLPGFLLSAT